MNDGWDLARRFESVVSRSTIPLFATERFATPKRSQSFGVAIAATILALLSGDTRAPTAADFVPAFLAVGLLPLISVAYFARLGREDGSQVSGYHAGRT